MIAPHGRRNCRCRIVPIQSNMPQRIAITVSIRNLPSNGTGQMSATVPITNRILNILLPTIFPIAMPAFPFLAAETDVTSSGSDVPKATIVSPIKRSLMPHALAIVVAPFTTKLLPATTSTAPNTINSPHFHNGYCANDWLSSSPASPFFARKYK